MESDGELPAPEGAPVFALDARQKKQIVCSVRDGCVARLKVMSRDRENAVARSEALSAKHEELDAKERKAWGDPKRGEPLRPKEWEKIQEEMDKYARARLSQHDELRKIEKHRDVYLKWTIEDRVSWALRRSEGRL